MSHQTIFLLLFISSSLTAAPAVSQSNPAIADSIYLNEITVTATKSRQEIKNIPARVQLITQQQIETFPALKVDDYLRFVTGINTTRTSGIFSMRPSVTLRGVANEQGRTLVLMDGVPLNISNDGAVNWNRINPSQIEKIELFKGPGSSLYGNNAMGGTIHLISRKPKKKFEAIGAYSFGPFNTHRPELSLGGQANDKITWGINGFYQSSDGYNSIPPDSRQNPDYSIARFLEEASLAAHLDFTFTPWLKLTCQIDYFKDKRGEGEKIEATNGEYRHFNTYASRLRINGTHKKFSYDLNLYGQKEDYFRIDERMRNGLYSRFDVNSDRDDYGAIFNSNYLITKNHTLTTGIEYKYGHVKGGDYYTTSDAVILNQGKLESKSLYLQDQLHLLNNKLQITGGVRLDHVRFFDGAYDASGANTDDLAMLNARHKDHSWLAVSPRLAMRYHFTKQSSAYLSYSKGFRAPILEDLTRSGIMMGRYITANPQLGPEYLDNLELGMNITLDKFIIEPTLYHAIGRDFQYYIDTGETMNNRPLFRRENITRVAINGFELDVRYLPTNHLSLNAGYTYNHSTIKEFKTDPQTEGKFLEYTPKHKATAGFLYQSSWFNFALNALYKDKQYTSDDNETWLDEYITFDLQISRHFLQGKASLSWMIRNLLDNQRMETATDLSPGRIMEIKLGYRI